MFQSLNYFVNENVVLYIHTLPQRGLESLKWVDCVLDQLQLKEIMKLTTVGNFLGGCGVESSLLQGRCKYFLELHIVCVSKALHTVETLVEVWRNRKCFFE